MNRTAVILLSVLLAVSCSPKVPDSSGQGGEAAIFPDYAGVTVPRTIAPLNFRILSESDKSVAVFESASGRRAVKGPEVGMSISQWRDVIADSDSIEVTIYAKKDGKWLCYNPFSIYVNDDPIDGYLCYRRIFPGYGAYRAMGIYQRDLSTFKESLIFGHEDAGGAKTNATCVNCHAFSSCDPSTLHMHIRGKLGGTLIGDKVYALKNPADGGPNPTYVNWSHDGRFIAYSAEKVKQWFNSSAGEILEVADISSELLVYDVEANIIRSQPAVDSTKRVLMPVFGPDTDRLYYCMAEPQDTVYNVRYGLYSIPFDPSTGLCHGETRCEIGPEEGSISFPRISYDGKYLIYSMGPYGYFHAWHKDSDLYILDLGTGERRALDEVNSADSESCHSWSLSSRWIVFASRRDDGLYSRPYIAHIDESGNCSKPFLLPQKDCDYYTSSMFSFNLPEFVSGEVTVKAESIFRSLQSPQNVNVTPTR